jgi:HTH-type transcriptional regulator / antitoxin HipB
VRNARKQLTLTQPQLALAAGVGVRFIVELEAGKPTLRLENILRVVHALGGEIQLSGWGQAESASSTKGDPLGA